MVHEREDARLLLLRLLDHDARRSDVETLIGRREASVDHDADAELHERFAEVDDAFTHRRNGQRSYCNVRLLRTQ